MVFRRKRPAVGALDPLLLIVSAYVGLLSVLGGGNQVFGLPVLLLMAATIMFVGTVLVRRPALPEIPGALKIGMALIIAVPLLQLVPLPPALWQSLPGNALRADVLALVGEAGRWQPLSLEPVYTAQTLVMAAGFVALFLSLLALDPRSFERVLQALLALILTGILVGVLQITTGGAFPRFFEQADTGALIGFYSNKNHMALALAASLPLAQVVLASDRKTRPIRHLFFFAYWVVALIAILATASRAGLALGVFSSVAIALPRLGRIGLRQRLFIMMAIVVAGVIVAASAPFQAMLARFDYIGDDNRWLFTLRSLPLVREYWLAGAGGGVFGDLFITSETIEWVKPTIMNHVHNDYVEMVIEYGIPGVIALIAIAIGIAQSALGIGGIPKGSSRALRLEGLLIVVLIALHSLVDYPLRRPAVLAIFAIALAMVVRPTVLRDRNPLNRRKAPA